MAGIKGRPFTLNCYSINDNPMLGSHDPSMLWDPLTEKYYSYSTDVYKPEWGLKEKIGIPVRSSPNLVDFHYEGTVLSEEASAEGSDNGTYPSTYNFWAPYVEYVKGEYRMYYSATKAFGSSESRIWLAVAKHPLGPFENRGVAADTWGTDDTLPNAIDPHIIWDKGRCYLVYGSFFGGIYLKEMDAESGLPKDKNPRTLGICISRRAKEPRVDGPEGAAALYVPETGYFYLFQSYGWLGDTYDIRVGRSREVQGPYADWNGLSLVEESMGLKLANSYYFCGYSPPDGGEEKGWRFAGFRGPGHGVPFYDPVTERYFFVHHVRDGAPIRRSYDQKEGRYSFEAHYMMIRPMFFVKGWPVLGPEPYGGEALEPVAPLEDEAAWEMVMLDDKDNDIKLPLVKQLKKNSEYYSNGVIYSCWDFENQKPAVALTGIDNYGLAYWGKFMYSSFRKI